MSGKKQDSGSSFSGKLGFVLAAAGSAVGLGNLWRFPRCAAVGGGGLYLLIYIVLAFTLGIVVLTTEIAIGRSTKKSPLGAYSSIKKGWGFLGVFSFIVPIIILSYYNVIGGWILKYIVTFVTTGASKAAEDSYFVDFITGYEPILFMAIFLVLNALIIFLGVSKGIERMSKILMPTLLVIIIFIGVYSLFLKHEDADGTVRTGWEGFKVYVVPDFTGLDFPKLMKVIVDAIAQIFFSLSVAMGIMITYGSYVKDEVNLNSSTKQIVFFDTLIAFLAGLIIIPTVYAFNGRDGLQTAGPGLVFQALPKIFNAMGPFGIVVGILFFLMITFAALTSSVSIFETITADVMAVTKKPRKLVTILVTVAYFILSTVICLGYNKLYFDVKLPNGSHGQILDVADFLSNNVMMPLIAFMTSIFIGWVVGPKYVKAEMEKGGAKYRLYGMYYVMIKFVVPVVMLILLLQAFGAFSL